MLFGFRTIAFKRFPLESALQTISKFGYNGVELCLENEELAPTTLESSEIKKIKVFLKNIGLNVASISYHEDFVANERDFNAVFKAISLTEEFEHNLLIIAPGYLRTLDKKVLLKKLIEKLELLLPEAEKRGVVLALEPEPKMILENVEDTLELMEIFNSKNLRINLDIGHSHIVGESIKYSLETLKDYIVHLHMEDIKDRVHRHLIPGEGDLNFREIFQVLKDISYNGFSTIDLFDLELPEKAAEISINYLNSTIASMR